MHSIAAGRGRAYAERIFDGAYVNVNLRKFDMRRLGYECAHILVKHAGSRHPSSWRSDNITRSKEDARNILEQYIKQIKESANPYATFQQLAKEYSDCSSARKNGDLGMFGRRQMQKPFEEASFALDVGEMSDVVDTHSGLHVIWRIAEVIQKLFTPHSDFLYCISML